MVRAAPGGTLSTPEVTWVFWDFQLMLPAAPAHLLFEISLCEPAPCWPGSHACHLCRKQEAHGFEACSVIHWGVTVQLFVPVL